MKLINIGFGNMVSASRLVAIVSPESAPIKRIMQDAKEQGTLIDATIYQPCPLLGRWHFRCYNGAARFCSDDSRT